MDDKEKLRKAFNLRGDRMSDKEKLEAIKEIVDIYDMKIDSLINHNVLGEDVKKIKEILEE